MARNIKFDKEQIDEMLSSMIYEETDTNDGIVAIHEEYKD